LKVLTAVAMTSAVFWDVTQLQIFTDGSEKSTVPICQARRGDGWVETEPASSSQTLVDVYLTTHYATSRKIAGSIPDEAIGFFI
jgi:hypothetical protein